MYKTIATKLKDISKHRLIFVGGEEEYFISNARKGVIKEHQNLPLVTLENPSISEIQTELSTQDLFSETKLILIENFEFVETTTKKKLENKEIEELLSSLENNDQHIVVFVNANKIDKRRKITKDLIKNSYFIDCKSLAKREFSSFLSFLIKKYELNISSSLQSKLSFHLSEVDLMLLDKEFEKLSLYPDSINEGNIYELLSVSNQEKVFALMDFIVAGKIKEALDTFDNLLFNKESEYMIYSFLSNQFTHILKIKMIKEDKSLIDIPKQLKIHPFMAKNLEKSSQRYTLSELISMQSLLLETDINIKEGVTDSIEAVRYLIMSLTNHS